MLVWKMKLCFYARRPDKTQATLLHGGSKRRDKKKIVLTLVMALVFKFVITIWVLLCLLAYKLMGF